METLDTALLNPGNDKIIYGGFWPRFGALLLDGLILAPVAFGLSYFNTTQWKSTLLLVIISLVGAAYKPFCEYKYGATPGKMALNLKVVNLEFGQANMTEIILRNIFNIVPAIITLALTITVFGSSEFQSVTGYIAYSQLLSQVKGMSLVTWTNFALLLLDIIFLLSDNQKRSLHDRIGKTYVIEKRQLI